MSSRAKQAKRVGSTIKDGSESSKHSKSNDGGCGTGSSGVSSFVKASRNWGFGK